jgi:hypothetical protein
LYNLIAIASLPCGEIRSRLHRVPTVPTVIGGGGAAAAATSAAHRLARAR